MGGASLIATFGWVLSGLAAASCLTAVVATAHGEPDVARSFVTAAGAMVFVGVTMIVGFRSRDIEPHRRNSLALIAALWTFLPVFAALPIILVMEIAPVPAYFEAVSSLTTTGATAFASIDALPRGIVFWRSILEWLGGGLTIVLAAAALDASQASGQSGVHLLSAGVVKGSRLASIFRNLIPIYAASTALCFIALRVAGVPGFDAACLALSVLSTGGAMPNDGDLADYGAAVAPIVIVFMVIGAASFLAIRSLWSKSASVRLDIGRIGYALFIASLTAFLIAMIFVQGAGKEDVGFADALIEGVFATASLISTSGFMHDNSIAVGIPLPIVMTLLLIGGAYGSTAGGLKIGRVGQMVEDASRELDWLVHPSAVSGSERGRSANIEPRRVLWSYFVAYLMAAALISVVLAGAGIRFEPALLGAVAVVSNAGPAIDFLSADVMRAADLFAALPDPTKLVLAAGMILGRIEFLAALAILTPVFWRR